MHCCKKSQLIQQRLQQEEQEIQLESQKQMDTMVKTVKKFIKEYGKQNGYTYILGSNEAGSVLYGQEENNITKDVLKALNEEYAKKD